MSILRIVAANKISTQRRRERGVFTSSQRPLRLRVKFPFLGLTLVLLSGMILSACQVNGMGTQPVIKIGLVAPFEGRYREIGYDVIFAARLAVQEANRAGGVNGHSIELIAMDDRGDVNRAVEQASKLARDPQVIAVIGHFLPETTEAAAEVYANAGIPMLATADLANNSLESLFQVVPDQAEIEAAAEDFGTSANLENWYFCDCAITEARDVVAERETEVAIGPSQWGFNEFRKFLGQDGVYFVSPVPRPLDLPEGQAFYDRYTEISYGTQPAAFAVLTYDIVNAFFNAMTEIGEPSNVGRTTVAEQLSTTSYSGLSGEVAFEDGVWSNQEITVYRWDAGVIVKP